MGVIYGVDIRDLSQAGWGVIFAADTPAGVRAALEPLLTLRRQQAGKRFRLYEHADGFQTTIDSTASWLARHSASFGPADPDKVPYYLLIVGDLDKIPLWFQQQLDVQYAIGRLWFDTPEELASYAKSVVAAESSPGLRRSQRQATFLAVGHKDDQPTSLSAQQIVKPLAEQIARLRTDWSVDITEGFDVTKGHLLQLMQAENVADLLFLSGHGMVFPTDDPRQQQHQGALLCANWPGPENWQGPVPKDFYFSADDIPPDAQLLGRIVFMLASYSVGTIVSDTGSQSQLSKDGSATSRSFLAQLPQKLLAHPQGGILAFIGLANQMWGDSYALPTTDPMIQVWTSILQRLMAGYPIGFAMEQLNERYAELAADLTSLIQDFQFGRTLDPSSVVRMWTAWNDARDCVLLGDPAVRLL